MRWWATEWFGGIKVECEECGLHASEWREREGRAVMRAIRQDYHVPHCITCAHECNNMDKDIPDLSLRNQLNRSRAEKVIESGDYAYNVATGETRLVIGFDQFRKEITFSGETRWVSAKNWCTNVSMKGNIK